jgi:NTP pyrophosphatase (non-canonical NTP hydrolase)
MDTNKISKMQIKAKEFIDKNNLHRSPRISMMDLLMEIGDLCKEVLIAIDNDKKKFEFTPQVVDELGDCLFYILILCNDADVDANEALNNSLLRYEGRFAEKGYIGLEENR